MGKFAQGFKNLFVGEEELEQEEIYASSPAYSGIPASRAETIERTRPVQQAAPAPAQQVANPNPNPFPPMPQEPPQGAAGGVDASGQPLPF